MTSIHLFSKRKHIDVEIIDRQVLNWNMPLLGLCTPSQSQDQNRTSTSAFSRTASLPLRPLDVVSALQIEIIFSSPQKVTEPEPRWIPSD